MGFYTAAPGSSYEVYTGSTLATKTLATSGTLPHMGYHTVTLPSSASVTAGQSFVVAVKLTSPGTTSPIAIEYPVSGYSSAATAKPGQSYVSSTGTSWTDLTTNSGYENANVCLKAYAAPAATLAPTVTAPNGGEDWELGSAQTVTWSTGSGGAVTIELSRNDGSSWETLWASTGNDGSQTWTVGGAVTSQALVRISNLDGSDVSDETFSLSSPSYDATPPTTTATGADADWHIAPVTITLTAIDNAGGSGMSGGEARTEYRLDSGDWTTGTSVTVAAPADHSGDGEHLLLYRSTDAAGNVEDAESCTVRIDTMTPVGTFALSGGAATTTTTAVSGASAVTDANGPLQMRFSTDGKATWSSWGRYIASTALTLPGGLGSKIVYAQYRDSAGNTLELSDAIELVASADVTGPTIGMTGAAKGKWYRSAVLVTLTASDSGSGVASITYVLDGVETSVPSSLAVVSVPASPNARHTLTCHATDAAANSLRRSDAHVRDRHIGADDRREDHQRAQGPQHRPPVSSR